MGAVPVSHWHEPPASSEAQLALLPAVANQRGRASLRAALARGHDIC